MLALDNIVGAQLALGGTEGQAAVPGFAHVSEIADQRVQTLDKYLRVGQKACPAVVVCHMCSCSSARVRWLACFPRTLIQPDQADQMPDEHVRQPCGSPAGCRRRHGLQARACWRGRPL